ncbi:hypothetical protein OQA88_4562 [Cercophora sp. LCS_1]
MKPSPSSPDSQILRLCEICDAIPPSPRLSLDNGHDHYPSLSRLYESASGNEYCHLCQMMWESIVKTHQKQRFNLGNHPLLREAWPIRIYGISASGPQQGVFRGYDALELRCGNRAKSPDTTWVTTNTRSGTEYPIVSRLFLHKGDEGSLLLYTTICLDDASPVSFSLAARLLDTCLKTHHHGVEHAHDTLPELPTRVIDVGGALPNPRLVTKGQRQRENAQYAALSYCWGKSPAATTTPDNLPCHISAGLHLASLPQAIQDAVTAARSLSIQYLWVDALCILQGTSRAAAQDWLTESAKMSQTYGSATLVIIAGDSQDCNEPFLSRREIIPSTQRSRDGIPGRTIPSAHRTTTVPGYIDLHQNTWSTRAWTLQELALARRALIYTRDQVYFRCENVLVGLDGYTHVLRRIDALRLRLGEGQDWYRVVAEYSLRFMTNPDDKLSALAGLGRLFCEANGCTYVAGLCRETLRTGLLWRTECSGTRAPRRLSGDCWRAPSWSWASVDGPVDYDLADMYADSSKSEDEVEIEEVQLEYVNPRDPYGRLVSGSLLLKGKMKPVGSLILDAFHTAGDVYTAENVVVGRGFADEKRSWGESEVVEGPLLLLLVTNGAGLLLRPQGQQGASEKR